MATNPAGMAARINDERISTEEFQRQVDEVMASYRHRYGEDVFNGPNGEAAVRRVKASLMDDMVNRRLLLQEVRRKGYTSTASQREIDEEVGRVRSESGLNDRGFAEKLRFAGLTLDRFRQQVAEQLAINRFIDIEISGGAKNDTERQSRLSRWFSTVKTSANVTIYIPDAAPVPGAAGCGSGGSGCGSGGRGDCAGSCGSGVTQPIDSGLAAEIKEKALRYHAEHYGKDSVLTSVTNYGCHIQVDVLKDGKIVRSFTYSGGQFFEI